MQDSNSINFESYKNRSYTTFDRTLDDDLIYFLMPDRFYTPACDKAVLYHPVDYSQDLLGKRFGGTIKGMTHQLDYISGLGFTAIWMSPVFKNYPDCYHGYGIVDFMSIDPHLGTMDDLREFVTEAHRRDIKVILDIVINHTGNVWAYENDEKKFYQGSCYPFGQWRDADYPAPAGLRDPNLYVKKGAIQNWDHYPETAEGDIFELKKFHLENTAIGNKVLDYFISIYSYWIAELDIDGYRLDTVKHLPPHAVVKFTHAVQQFAYALGKKEFPVIAEYIGSYSGYFNLYRNPGYHASNATLPDYLLDFPTHFLWVDYLQGKKKNKNIFKLLQQKNKYQLKAGFPNRHYILFPDNHDQVRQGEKKRIMAELNHAQFTALWAMICFLPGVPCMYYGTEQALKGSGTSDLNVREPMFDAQTNRHYFLTETRLYLQIKNLNQWYLEKINGIDTEFYFPKIGTDAATASSDYSDIAIVFGRKNFKTEYFYMYNNTGKEIPVLKIKSSFDGYYEVGHGERSEDLILTQAGELIIYALKPEELMILEFKTETL